MKSKSIFIFIASFLILLIGLCMLVTGLLNLSNVQEFKTEQSDALNDSADSIEMLRLGVEQLKENEEQYLSGVSAYQNGLQQLEAGKIQLAEGAAQLAQGEEQYSQGVQQLEEAKAQVEEGKQQLEDYKDEYEQGKTVLQIMEPLYQASQTIGIDPLNIGDKYEEYSGLIDQYEQGESQIADAEQQIAEGEAQLESGRTTLDQGYIQLSEGQSELLSGQEQLEEGKEQLELFESNLAMLGTSCESLLSLEDIYDYNNQLVIKSPITKLGADFTFYKTSEDGNITKVNGKDYIDMDKVIAIADASEEYNNELKETIDEEMKWDGLVSILVLIIGLTGLVAGLVGINASRVPKRLYKMRNWSKIIIVLSLLILIYDFIQRHLNNTNINFNLTLNTVQFCEISVMLVIGLAIAGYLILNKIDKN